MNRTQTIICTAVAAVALALLASPTMPAAYFYPGAGTAAPAPPPTPRVCFPASKWSAGQHRRPCARVVRVAEDGTVRLRVENAGGRVRYSVTVGARDR